MCHGRGLNYKTNKINGRALRTVKNKKIQFRNFIKTWQIYVNLHEKPPVFQESETYNLKSGNDLAWKNIQTT